MENLSENLNEKIGDKIYKDNANEQNEKEKSEKENPKDNPKNCQFNSAECGNYTRHHNKNGCVILKDLQEDVGPLFGADVVITESDLICLRSKTILNLERWICAKHQFTLGKNYRPSAKCNFSEHPQNSKAKPKKVSWDLYNFVKSLDSSFVLGSMICQPCQKKLSKIMNEESMDCDEDDMDVDPCFLPDIPFLDDNEKMHRREELDRLSTVLDVDRVRFQISSDINDMAPESLSYFCRIYRKMQINLRDKFCRLVAPGHELEMKNILLKNKEVESQEEAVLSHLKEAYDTCSTLKAQRAVLMLIPKTYSKPKVAEVFGCSLYDITKARSILKLHGACGIEPTIKRLYSRLSIDKSQHFIDFLFSTGLLQEVAYGTTKLKFESGEKMTISNTILNGIFENAVKEYKIHCTEINYESLGRTTLLKMLAKMKPHTRRKLAGIDSFVVEGIEAFDSLRTGIKMLAKNAATTTLLKSVNESENYLKARYKMHCNSDDSCSTHCISYALSHPTDKELFSVCKKSHDRHCEECLTIVNCIASLKLMLSKLPISHQKDVTNWEVANAEEKIMEWQRHILRGVQQCKARSEAFKELGPTKAIWIRDYAQKVNPTKTLESMKEYFGKRGMTVSVEVFIKKSLTSYQKQVYLVALDRCDQDTLETLCIADVVIEQFKKDSPDTIEIELKTDNAGNYHANGVPEAMFKLVAKHGITLSSYNYNEAQLGKDQCDREAAIFKKCAEKWLLKKETHKISNAKELSNAIFSDGGPKNTKMCVLKIDKNIAKLEGIRKINNISYYHNVEFKDDGALYKEYFDIGKGKFYKFNDITFVNASSFFVDWISSQRQDGLMVFDSRNNNDSFSCPEPLCILDFLSENEMLRHVSNGTHQFAKIRNGMDKALSYYVQQKHILNVTDESTSSNYAERMVESKQSFSKLYPQGWARKFRRVKRFTDKQKQYIEKLFHEGATTNSKLSAEQMAENMKHVTVNGNYCFLPEEYLQPSQIRGLITRLKKSSQIQEFNFNISEDDGILKNIDNICDFALHSDDEDFAGFDSESINIT